MLKLYVYEHCPFCVRARMIVGMKGIECDISFLPNNDEKTPLKLIGKKMLPILEMPSSNVIGESLDIVAELDELNGIKCLSQPAIDGVQEWIDKYQSSIYKLAIPRWAYSSFPEFEDVHARQYFIDKKQGAFGSFSFLLAESANYIEEVNLALLELEPILKQAPMEKGALSQSDILLYPVLRAISIVKGINWPAGVDAWRQRVSQQVRIPLHDDISM